MKCQNKNCKKSFAPSRPGQGVCSISCAIEYNKQKRDADYKKAVAKQKQADKEWRKEKRQKLNKLKTYTQRLNEARAVFQQWVRLRDKHLPCISCGSYQAIQWHGGHFLKAELYSGIIFNEDNCHKQCSQCNQFWGGMESEYRDGLLTKIGPERVINLESIKNIDRKYTYSDEEFEKIKSTYKAKIKVLEKNM